MVSKSIKNCKLLIKKLVLAILYFVIRKVLRYNVVAFENKDNFDGNSGAIFNYLLNNYKKKSLYVWLLKDKSNISQNYKNTFAYEHTEEAFTKDLLVYCADYLFCDDVIIGKKRKGQSVVYLTHGVPATKNVKGIINVPEYVDYAVSTSKATEALNRYQFSLSDKTQSIISGLPRTDVFGASHNEIKKITDREYKKVVIWLPTFRTSKYETDRNDSSVNLKYDLPLISSEDDYYKINDFLEKKNILLIIKLHPASTTDKLIFKSTSNIKIVSNETMIKKNINLYSLMVDTDALISDYSSVAYDYLLLNKPIGYIIDDIDNYTLGFSVDNILELMPGEKIKSVDNFIDFIASVNSGADTYCEERKKVNDYMNDYKDFKNCQRILGQVGFQVNK